MNFINWRNGVKSLRLKSVKKSGGKKIKGIKIKWGLSRSVTINFLVYKKRGLSRDCNKLYLQGWPLHPVGANLCPSSYPSYTCWAFSSLTCCSLISKVNTFGRLPSDTWSLAFSALPCLAHYYAASQLILTP